MDIDDGKILEESIKTISPHDDSTNNKNFVDE